MRAREAPSERRMPISRWRATPRASRRLATFAHPIIRIRPKATKIGAKSAMASSGCGTVPRRGTRSRLLTGRPAAPADRFESHAASCARACACDTPGFSRPTTSTPTPSWTPRSRGRNCATCDRGAHASGLSTSSPRNPAAVTPTIVNGAPLTSTVVPSTCGSRLKCRRQPLSLSTITALPPERASSAATKPRPTTGSTRTTWKKFPVTRVATIVRPATCRSISGTVA